MFKDPYEVIYLENHVDPRGSLFEMLRFKDNNIPGEGYIYCFTINPGQVRGGHYHTKKQEWFSCVSGRATVYIEDKNGYKKNIVLEAARPAIIYCGPYTSHSLTNESQGTAVIVSYGSRQHDPSNPDTFKK
ncbi:MAG: WxcM-like domain-containing protein [bacterium]|nr:WxcM-like domain-containing protein [bacterium]